jgi:hypothetical protein
MNRKKNATLAFNQQKMLDYVLRLNLIENWSLERISIGKIACKIFMNYKSTCPLVYQYRAYY